MEITLQTARGDFMKHIFLFCLVLVFGFQSQAMAHSTKGRMRVPLEKEVLTIDDIAYFFESYVHREFYKGKFERPEKRFYVNTFLGVDQQGDRAIVRFKTLDMSKGFKAKDIKQGKGIFEDHATIVRLDSGIWAFEVPGKTPVEMYTYVKKTAYYYKKYVMPVSIAGLALGVGILALLRLKKRKITNSENTVEHPAA